MLQAIFSPKVDGALRDLRDPLVIFLGFQLHERHNHRTHQVADLERALAAHEDRYPFVVPGRKRFRYDVQAMHAAHAVSVVHFQGVIILETHAARWAAGNDVVDGVLTTLLSDIRFPGVLIDLHIIAPGADDRHVGTLN